MAALDRKSDHIREVAIPVINQMAENTDYSGFVIPRAGSTGS